MRAFPLLIALGTLACTPGADPSDDPGIPPDPDVQSWSPPSFPPAAVDRIVFLGDSITAGYGIDNRANRYTSLLEQNNDTRWAEFIGDDLTARYGPVEVVDVSRSGAQTPDLTERQIPDLEAQGPFPGPTAVFITIGGNDLVNGLTAPGGPSSVPPRVEANIRAAVDELKALFPDGASILITNIYEPTDGEGQTNECFFGLRVDAAEPALDDANGRTLALAQEQGFAWVDLRAHFKGHGFNHGRETIDAYDAADPTLWLQDDCIHPTARGHHEIRRLFLAALDNEPLALWTPSE